MNFVKIFVVIVWLFGAVGQGMCAYRLLKCDFEPSYKPEVIYSISLVTGVGAVTGYIDFGR